MPTSQLTPSSSVEFFVQDYDLPNTLDSGQAFRWQPHLRGWEGVIGRRWIRLRQSANRIHAEVAEPATDWSWLEHYLQIRVSLAEVTASFPADAVLRRSVSACWGLRLLRQDPWECLASFILSSNKQIVQIRQMIHLICQQWGHEIPAPSGAGWRTFPSPESLAGAAEAQLRACKLGFRAPNLLSTARLVADGSVDLARLRGLELSSAREALMQLPGVGRKIADCVLLFAYGFQQAFPVDVWIMKALRQLYFPRRRPRPLELHRFVEQHFGPQAGYAQQYLFHYMRQKSRGQPLPPSSP